MTDPKSEKERVLALCSQLWGQVGLQGLTWDQVSQSTGIERAMLSRMFFSRDELVFQMLQREVGLLLEEAQSGLAVHTEVSGLIAVPRDPGAGGVSRRRSSGSPRGMRHRRDEARRSLNFGLRILTRGGCLQCSVR